MRAAILLLVLGLLGAKPVTFPVVFHVAVVQDAPVVEPAWLDAQLAQANAIFADHGVQLVRQAIVPLPEEHALLEDRADRNALGARLQPRVINAFIVASLRDVDDPTRLRQGVHWRPYGRKADARGRVKHLVIVAAYARPTVLAHELGHFFDNPQHSTVPGNIMSYQRGETLPVLDARQSRRMQGAARRFRRTGELVPAP
ncbi:MAG: hypothetical protein KC549_08715 [Myxococcales bacterium]|nr:hypothetical protein [Myxococcales bacterium]